MNPGDFGDITVYDLIEPQAVPFPLHETKDVLIILRSGEFEKEDRSLLDKILKAIGYDMDNVSLIQLDEDDRLPLSHMVRSESEKAVIVFGINPIDLGLQVENRKYSMLTLHSWQILLAESLVVIQDKLASKRALWGSLKNMFPPA